MKTTYLSQIVLLLAMVGAVAYAGIIVPTAASEEGYALAVDIIGEGTVLVTPDQPFYPAGQKVSLLANAEPGWQFVAWQAEFDTPTNWYDDRWRYRLGLTFGSGDFKRHELPAAVEINFTQQLEMLGASGDFDPAALRVVEIDAAGRFVSDQVPFQFDPTATYDPGSNASGTLIVLLTGSTPANSERYFHVYFETAGSAIEAVNFPIQVTVSDDVEDEGQLSFQIVSANASYFFQKKGAALSSLVDRSGFDWINYHPTGGAAGSFRGIPNIQPDYFHPGATSGSSKLVSAGPLRAVVQAKTDNGWEMVWEFYPRFATVTVLDLDKPYWFLYEGTPGGTLDITQDFMVRSNGTRHLTGAVWAEDLPDPEWLYFGDPELNRSLFLVHALDDDHIDSYAAMNGEMTVFGFGRKNLARYMNRLPHTFALGLMDTTNFNLAAETINGIYQPVFVELLQPEKKGTLPSEKANPLQLEVRRNMAITALFTQETYTLKVSTLGEGTVSITPQRDTYGYGDEIRLVATPAPGWAFAGWSGVVSGSDPETDLVMTGDTDVMATFVLQDEEVGLTIEVVGQGVVLRQPEGELVRDEWITLRATAANGWQFVGWSGDLVGSKNPASLRISGRNSVTATFTEAGYNLNLPLISSGSASKNP